MNYVNIGIYPTLMTGFSITNQCGHMIKQQCCAEILLVYYRRDHMMFLARTIPPSWLMVTLPVHAKSLSKSRLLLWLLLYLMFYFDRRDLWVYRSSRYPASTDGKLIKVKYVLCTVLPSGPYKHLELIHGAHILISCGRLIQSVCALYK